MSTADVATILLIVVTEGAVALFVVAAGVGLGQAWLRALRLHNRPRRWQIALAAGFGLPTLSLLMLALGSAGLLSRALWIVLLTVGAAAGVVGVMRMPRPGAPPARRSRWLWIGAVPFAALALAAATCPPGYLWPTEGNGYDALEYHLGLPHEWWSAGRVAPLPHNLYSYLPANAEMLYLLSFVVRGAPLAGLYAAQLLNVAWAGLAVAAAWLMAAELEPRAGPAAALLMASCPFVVYLCGVAYVECGLLATATLALACLVRGVRTEPATALRWAIASGLLAGLACGFKLTAGPLLVLPLAVAWALQPGRRGRRLVLFGLAAAATLAPWAIRNTATTGNPLFPLARGLFAERAGLWSDEAAARFAEGHRPDPAMRSAAARGAAAWRNVVCGELFGRAAWLLAALGLLWHRRSDRRLAVGAAAMIASSLAAWAALTHLVDRFALPVMPPVVLLATLGLCRLGSQRGALLAGAAALGAAAWNFAAVLRPFRDAGVFRVAAFGQTEWMHGGQWPGTAHIPRLNAIAAAGGRVAMLGEARTLYLDGPPAYWVIFSRNPLAEAFAHDPAGWLRAHGYSHLYVDWLELRRLARSRYGVWPELRDLTPARLAALGLTRSELFTVDGRPYASLHAVPK